MRAGVFDEQGQEEHCVSLVPAGLQRHVCRQRSASWPGAKNKLTGQGAVRLAIQTSVKMPATINAECDEQFDRIDIVPLFDRIGIIPLAHQGRNAGASRERGHRARARASG